MVREAEVLGQHQLLWLLPPLLLQKASCGSSPAGGGRTPMMSAWRCAERTSLYRLLLMPALGSYKARSPPQAAGQQHF